MLGKALIIGPLIGIAYLTIIMWWVTGFTPLDLINAIMDIVTQPLQQVTEALK